LALLKHFKQKKEWEEIQRVWKISRFPSQKKVRFSPTFKSQVFLKLKMKKQIQNFNKSDLAIHLSRKVSIFE
jgi:hypothetical protein